MPNPLTLAEIAARAPRLGGRRVGTLLTMFLEPMSPEEHFEARERAGLTQAELAERMGISRGAVAAREVGSRPVPADAALWLRQLISSSP